jgi:CRP/FNR family transcriptional regulator, dissimilatory nitrate respiration regulator
MTSGKVEPNAHGPLCSRGDLSQLSRLPLFAGLSPDATRALLADAFVQDVERHSILFMQGEPATTFYAVLDGWVKLHRNGPDGQESVIAVIAGGESFAEAAIFASERYPVTATVVSDARLLVIPGPSFINRLYANPELGLNMLASMSRRLRVLVRQLEHLSTRSAVERLAEFLLQQCPERDNGAASIRLPLDKHLIAARLGMQPETFSRALAKLRGIGVASQGDRISIPDCSALQRVVNRRGPFNSVFARDPEVRVRQGS